MTFAPALLGLVAVAIPPSLLWSGISTGQSMEAVARQAFVDARDVPHSLSRHAMIGDFYLQRNNSATVQIRYRGKPKLVCGIDIEGTRATLERGALLSELGPPASHVIRELLQSPGGSAALLSGDKIFLILTWYRGSTTITFEERVHPGYFAILYRGTDSTGEQVDC